MNLWLDDIRPMLPGFDLQAFTAEAAIACLATGQVKVISLDHDLGDVTAQTGYDVAVYIEEQAFLGTLPPLQWLIHSANPVGASRMQQALEKADQYWQARIPQLAEGLS